MKCQGDLWIDDHHTADMCLGTRQSICPGKAYHDTILYRIAR